MSNSSRTCTRLYSVLDTEKYNDLLQIQSFPPKSIERRFWNQSPSKVVDTTLRQRLYTSTQVIGYFKSLGQQEETYHLLILDRYRKIVEGNVNKLTLAERVEFFDLDDIDADVKEVEKQEKQEGVRIWGWLDIDSEVEEIRRIEWKESDEKWDIGKDLVW